MRARTRTLNLFCSLADDHGHAASDCNYDEGKGNGRSRQARTASPPRYCVKIATITMAITPITGATRFTSAFIEARLGDGEWRTRAARGQDLLYVCLA
jgi:hypothetical protein